MTNSKSIEKHRTVRVMTSRAVEDWRPKLGAWVCTGVRGCYLPISIHPNAQELSGFSPLQTLFSCANWRSHQMCCALTSYSRVTTTQLQPISLYCRFRSKCHILTVISDTQPPKDGNTHNRNIWMRAGCKLTWKESFHRINRWRRSRLRCL